MTERNSMPPFRSVAFMLSSVGYAVSRKFHGLLGPLSLEPGEFALLRAVSANEGESQASLAEHLRISPSWMVAVVDQLEGRDLIARKPHAKDRRVRTLHLTPAGKKLLQQAERQAQQFDKEVASVLNDKEVGQLLDLLDRIAAGLELEPGAHAALRD